MQTTDQRFRYSETVTVTTGTSGTTTSTTAGVATAGTPSTGTPRPKAATRTGSRANAPIPRPELPDRLTAAPNDRPVHHVRVALDTRLRALLSHDAGARTGADVEDVHQMRVSVRRMRAALKAARPLLDAEWSDGLREELGWLGRSLGPVRDLDVLLPHLRGLAADLSAAEQAAAEQLIAVLDEDYLVARRDMLAALNTPRYSTLLERLADAVRLPLPTRSATDARPELVELVRVEYRSLRKAVLRAGQNPPDAVLHALRIKGKRLRYTGELAEPALGGPVRRLLAATAELQEVLGDHQDACVAQERIRELLPRLGDRTDPEVFFVAGRMTEREHGRAGHLRTLWWDAWKNVRNRGEAL
jgi:CHAD domain-containing protein